MDLEIRIAFSCSLYTLVTIQEYLYGLIDWLIDTSDKYSHDYLLQEEQLVLKFKYKCTQFLHSAPAFVSYHIWAEQRLVSDVLYLHTLFPSAIWAPEGHDFCPWVIVLWAFSRIHGWASTPARGRRWEGLCFKSCRQMVD